MLDILTLAMKTIEEFGHGLELGLVSWRDHGGRKDKGPIMFFNFRVSLKTKLLNLRIYFLNGCKDDFIFWIGFGRVV